MNKPYDPLQDFSGPIPGENYTSDTKNYPWHRTPDFTNLDDAIDFVIKKITEPDTSQSLLTLLETGITVSSIVDMLVTEGIGKGRWTVDFALLMAGPVARIICILARGYDVEYDLGINQKNKAPTKAFYNAIQKDKKKQALQEEESGDNDDQMENGFVGLLGSNPGAMEANEQDDVEY